MAFKFPQLVWLLDPRCHLLRFLDGCFQLPMQGAIEGSTRNGLLLRCPMHVAHLRIEVLSRQGGHDRNLLAELYLQTLSPACSRTVVVPQKLQPRSQG